MRNKVFIQLGFLFIFSVLCAPAFAKNKNKKSNVQNITTENPSVEDLSVVRYANTKAISLKSKNAIIIDYLSGKILLEKKPHERIIPASMTKIMTSYLIEEKLKNKQASYDLLMPVSEKAWRMQGSKTFVPLGEQVSLENLLKGIIIQSGNDACIVAAEGLYGSEENFVEAMNEMAHKMGLQNTHFENASGWPSPNHYSTVYDLAQLGKSLIKDHPEYYSIYSEKTFTFGKDSKDRPITQGNRNPLLYDNLECDGIKSGHTDEGGYGLVLSFMSDKRRYIAVINGLKSAKERSIEAHAVLNWVKENFTNKKLYSQGDVVEEKAPVDFGIKKTIQLVTNKDYYILLPRSNQMFKLEKKLKTPIEAPVQLGDVVGEIKITMDNDELSIPIIANENIERIGFFKNLLRKVLPSI